MLQKIFVVLLGFIVSIVGALAPSGLFASNTIEGNGSFSGTVTDELLTTVDASGGAFTRVNTLWIELDGKRVTEDAWGTGDVKELRFKVGVKDMDGKKLAIGDRVVELHPTDIITVRMFKGDFAYRDVDISSATLQLQGTVKTTLVNQGTLGTKVRTEAGVNVDKTLASSNDKSQVAYVVLDTGARVDTVAVETGGRRFITEDVTTATQAKNEPGNLLAQWVKVDGKIVREYTWGDGALSRIEFQPAAASSSTAVVAFDNVATEALAGQTVRIKDFVGEYSIYQVTGGNVRLRLDGYAATYTVGDDITIGFPVGGTAPIAAFDFSPPNPRSTDTIRFESRSDDPDGQIVFSLWDFGGQMTDVRETTDYRFRAPGIYEVKLKVTDNDLQTSEITRNITVRNADPVPDFDYAPKQITSDTIVTFNDRSLDSDGKVVNWTWDFGDGLVSYASNPNHRYVSPGNATVTLMTRDDLGGAASITKTLIVRNAPPVAEFHFTPHAPQSQVPVQFIDESFDRDGTIVDWKWNFGDGARGTGSNPIHSYAGPGVYPVTLTAIDNSGGEARVSHQVNVSNRPAVVDFIFTPNAPTANQQVTFTSTATDPDGFIAYQEWAFSDDGSKTTGASATRAFPRAGTYSVNLTVIDSSFATSWLNRTITIDNSAPIARLGALPNPAFRGMAVRFADLSTDPDGDSITAWTWNFGDGTPESYERNPLHTYSALGVYTVSLNVTDASGRSSSASIPMTIQNARPTMETVSILPRTPVAGQTIFFNATATDVDAIPGQPLTYEWRFSDITLSGANVTRSFPANGEYPVTVVATDSEGATSPALTRTIIVDYATPLANFSWLPIIPTENADMNFTDSSSSPNGEIVSWAWQFGDGTTSTATNPSHRYAQVGPKTVTLTVTDLRGKQNVSQQSLIVNARPTAFFEMDKSGVVPVNTLVTFTESSEDPDNNITEWRWDYGDGAVDVFNFRIHPTHVFTMPGPKTIKLTVRDDANATHTAEARLDIANQRPLARWSYSPTNPIANAPVSFTSLSGDNDGTPISGWTWTFGDGTSSNVGNVSHVYTLSGEYLTTLRVHDGQLESLIDTQSFRLIRVGGDHPIDVTLTARYPDGRAVDLSAPQVQASVEVVRGSVLLKTIPKGQLIPNGDMLTTNLGIGDWARGDQVRLWVQNTTFQSTPMLYVFSIPSDGVTAITHEFELPLPLVATLTVDKSDRALVDALGSNQTGAGIPVYRDPTQEVGGRGQVTFMDGANVQAAKISIEMRYKPLTAAGNTASGENGLAKDFFGWCTVTSADTDATGNFQWSTRKSLCTSSAIPFPPGVYEVRAFASYATARTTYSAVSTFIVDPTGTVVEVLEEASN